ncbi:MAG TPA: hypothetical protein PLM75_08410, partial [bacterium]|nr:hypothetical protein [bacterium]
DNDPINQRYEAVSEILSGQGYFTIFPEETVLTLSGSFFNDTYIQQLHPGWNQVASPYYYLVDWKNMKIQTTDNKILSVAAAETEGLIINKIFWFKDNVYYWGPNNEIPNPKLYVWTGFWVYARQSCRLLFVPGFSYTINDKINLAPRRIKGTVNDWQMLVSIKGNEISDLFNYIGVNANIDKLKKAPKFSNLLYAGLMNNNEVLCQDFRPPIQTAEEWHLTISNGNNTNITIEFPNIENVPDEYDIYLVNRADNSIYNLRENNAVNITQPKNRDRKYSIIVGYPEYVKALLRAPLSKDVSFAYPNPGPDVNDKVKFRCNNIDANGRLKIKIFDMAGRKVCERNVVLNNYPIGDYEWDCRNDAGKSVGSGVYIYIIEYISPIGESYKLIDKLGIIK